LVTLIAPRLENLVSAQSESAKFRQYQPISNGAQSFHTASAQSEHAIDVAGAIIRAQHIHDALSTALQMGQWESLIA
jgi:hypothetical protein